jgi:diaminohydroxyphosphoribosylaminopyrimidine deaminase/5-amino-6-(5-phosphoribosylamino)uracil reductase
MGIEPATGEIIDGLPAHVIGSAFAEALRLASEHIGATAPNPPVGCLLLDAAGRTLTAAAHRKAGDLHAEAAAIALSRDNGTFHRIHTVVVTLEPCNHTGRTPPCADAILGTPARELWIGVGDPNPHVAGGGAARLGGEGGLAVRFLEDLDHPHTAELAAAARRLTAPFAKRVRTGLPWVTVKQARDRLGSMVPPAGRKTFTSDASLDFAHALRKRADAILTGSGTVLADAPEFTVRRVPDFPGKHRQLVILDRRGRVDAAYLAAAGARGFEVTLETSLQGALARLGAAGTLEVLVEAGIDLTAAILASDLWDEHVLIEQHPTPGNADIISIRERCDHMSTAGKARDVLRNH